MSSLKLENGCFYRQRDGKVVGPVVAICDISWDYWIPTLNFRSYRKDGKSCLSGWIEKQEDLIDKVSP